MSNIPESLSIAVHTLAKLAENPGVSLPGKSIAEECGFSPNHLSKILPRLARAKLLESRTGPAGGVCFTGKPEKITLAMVRDAVEGRPAAKKGCLLPHEVCPGKRCALGCLLSKMEAEFQRVFNTTTLADILRGVKIKRK